MQIQSVRLLLQPSVYLDPMRHFFLYNARSASQVVPNCRIYDTHGILILNQGSKLFASSSGQIALLTAIQYDAGGTAVTGGEHVWTGTIYDGSVGATVNNCMDWALSSGNGYYGTVGSTNDSWTNAGSEICTYSRHIYCIEQ